MQAALQLVERHSPLVEALGFRAGFETGLAGLVVTHSSLPHGIAFRRGLRSYCAIITIITIKLSFLVFFFLCFSIISNIVTVIAIASWPSSTSTLQVGAGEGQWQSELRRRGADAAQLSKRDKSGGIQS